VVLGVLAGSESESDSHVFPAFWGGAHSVCPFCGGSELLHLTRMEISDVVCMATSRRQGIFKPFQLLLKRRQLSSHVAATSLPLELL
jgi:hypothetical protein